MDSCVGHMQLYYMTSVVHFPTQALDSYSRKELESSVKEMHNFSMLKKKKKYWSIT